MAQKSQLQRKAVEDLTLVDGLGELGRSDEEREGAAAGAAPDGVDVAAEESDDVRGVTAAADEGLDNESGDNGIGGAELAVEEDGVVGR